MSYTASQSLNLQLHVIHNTDHDWQGCVCAGVTVNAFLWYDLNPSLASLAGNCSYFLAAANTFSTNHANVAGAVIYSTNVTAMAVCCTNNQTQRPGGNCPEWNADGASANTVGSGAVGLQGYGPGLAFQPHIWQEQH